MREVADRLTYVGSGKKPVRKIAMVGTADSGSLAPYDDPSYEIWGVSSRMPYVTRADRWFEIHRLSGEAGEWMALWRKDLGVLAEQTDLYMLFPMPGAIPYPFDRITERFGTYFMTSSFSWMMALAIDELRPADGDPVDGEISIYGVDMEYGTEWAQQRAGFRHFLDLARAWDIGITRLAASGLSYEPVPYPMWQDDPLINKLDKRQVESRNAIANHEKALSSTRTLAASTAAILDEMSKFEGEGYDIGSRRKALEKELTALTETADTIEKDIIRWTSVEGEQSWLRDYLSA